MSQKKLILSRKSERYQEEINSKSREIEGVNSPNISGLQDQKMQEKKSIKPDIHTQETAKNSETKCCEYYLPTTKEDDWIEYVSSRK